MTQPSKSPESPLPLRKEGREKVTGRAQYVDDLTFPNMIFGTTVRSSVPRGRIRKIFFEGDLPWNEIVIVSAKDIPGKNSVAHILDDQPCLADELIHHAEEPILLLGHSDRFLLEEARRNVRIEIDPLPPVLSIDDSLARKEIIWGKDNTFKSFLIQKGDVNQAWNKAHLVVEGEYFSGAQEQLYIEPNGMIAFAEPGNVTVWGSMQCPYYVHHALTSLFGLNKEKVRVVQAETGGGFGGKEDYPSILALHAALLSRKSGRPAKFIYDRAEDMAATTKRHPSRTRHRTAVTKDGKLLAMDIDFVLDGGAYATLSSVVLSRGSIHAAGPYDCPNVRISSRAVATNTPPHGAFRGFGAPQSIFALERHMDHIAAELGLAPDEFRRRNLIQEGQTTATGQRIREKPDLEGLLKSALDSSDYNRKSALFTKENRKPGQKIKRGMGISVFMHGAGFTGSGEKFLASVAGIEATPEGKIRVLASSTEIGQGARTVFSQIASETLAIEFDDVEVVQPDTNLVPNSGPTVASRTTMVVGKLIESASLALKETLIQSGYLANSYTRDEFKNACANFIARTGPLRVFSQYQQPEHIQWDDEKYLGDAYGTFAWAVYVAEVSVDLSTFETRVENFVAAQEIGKVMHPLLAEGQIEGGVVQAIGYALYEDVLWKNGSMWNNRLTNYIIPTATDIPRVKVLFKENPYRYGPKGAKGIGELPMDGVAPAILNAVEFATGARVDRIPLLPEGLMKALQSPEQGKKVLKRGDK